MADFTFDVGDIEQVFNYQVIISKFENQTEQRRLIQPNQLVGFKIRNAVLTKSQYQEFQTFYETYTGSLDTFTFDSPFDDRTYNVRFEPDTFNAIFRGAVYNVRFELTVAY